MRRFVCFYSAVLVLFTVYLALDTFVIARVYAPVEAIEAAPAQTTAPVVAETTAATTEASYTLTEHRTNDTTVYVVTVAAADPAQLRTVLAQGAYGRNVTEATSSMAARAGAAIAVNGDFYGSRERGYVVRNGELLRATSAGGEDLVIWADGSFSIIDEDDITAAELVAEGAEQVFCFGPALVIDGEVAVDPGEEVGKAMASNPRTAIGIDADGRYYLVVSDGRTRESTGLSLRELAEFMQSLGCTIAYNLDGGGSSTMVVDGAVVNNPTTNGKSIKERSVSDCVCIIIP
ncbi:MAG: phosphodiester glycosidase family protein [Clostridia bacterium]|nr:phosphodiester glycosidase family protein [Clostridia bacterium]